ncbi:hypothetical protein L1O48_06665 [Ligilactobacillus equi]|uniref:hypothetical protein n=1 Tax=Ligilactobacillus equi TaxID=137357 RepID=UPI002ED44575
MKKVWSWLGWLAILGLPFGLLVLAGDEYQSLSYNRAIFICLYCWGLVGLCLTVYPRWRHYLGLEIRTFLTRQKVQHSRLWENYKGVLFYWTPKVTLVAKWGALIVMVIIWFLVQFDEKLTASLSFILTFNALTFLGLLLYGGKLLWSQDEIYVDKRH